MCSLPWRHRYLIVQLVRREVLGRYRGSLIGLLWSFLTPALMLAVYTFVFSVVFQARWGGAGGGAGKVEFALILFSGLIVFNLFAECISQAPGLILANTNYVKRVVFPLEILPWVSLGSALFHAGINLVVLLVALLVTGHGGGWAVLTLPLVLLPFLWLVLGLSWWLSASGVFLRDISQMVGMVITVLMFLSPIFYPLSAMPASVHGWLFLNPLAFIIEQTREVLIWNRLPDAWGLGWYTLVALTVAWSGFFWFQKTRKGFADVL
ncbi:MAG: ABC transporter permease [Sterolibacterium sp.]|jgi:lipopolysaccharide transport system permease protein|nr:ABC transporter permease [Sterolibacterium sp.]